MLVIGLTGGIASGKTTISGRFSEHGVPVLDADRIARELVEPGQPALAEIVKIFGTQVLDPQGRLDRPALRRIVFADPKRRAELEGLLHPLVRRVMEQRLQELAAPYCILSIPLLLESGMTDLVDRVLVVDLPERMQMDRMRVRDGLSERDARDVMSAQTTRDARLAAADDVIHNAGTLEDLLEQVDVLHQNYRELAGTSQ
jgi:dephospho-CoA kinase